MSANPSAEFPDFRLIRDAITAAPPCRWAFHYTPCVMTGCASSYVKLRIFSPFWTTCAVKRSARAIHRWPLSFSLFRLFERLAIVPIMNRLFDRRRRLAAWC